MPFASPYRPPMREAAAGHWRDRVPAAVLVLVVHWVLLLALLRGLGGIAPVRPAVAPPLETRAITLDPPAPAATPDPPQPGRPRPHRSKPDQPAAAGAAGRLANPAPEVAVAVRWHAPPKPAAPAAGTGTDSRAGTAVAGAGNGSGTTGTGTGLAGSGDGTGGGGGGGQRAVKIAGDITSGRDYPEAGRAARLGTSVIVALTVGTDGRVIACRVRKPSGDPASDAVTCRLATERFRFRPAQDAQGHPVESLFGWEQRFFAP